MCCKLNLGCKRTAQLAFFWPLPEVLVKVRGCLELHFWPLHLKVGSKAETPPFQCRRLRSATGRPLELQCLLLSLVSSLGRLCQGGVSYFAVSKVIRENFIQTTVAPSSRVACLSKSQCGKFPRKAELWCWQSRHIPNSWEQFCFFFNYMKCRRPVNRVFQIALSNTHYHDITAIKIWLRIFFKEVYSNSRKFDEEQCASLHRNSALATKLNITHCSQLDEPFLEVLFLS